MMVGRMFMTEAQLMNFFFILLSPSLEILASPSKN
jgi:hypothetical protein